MFSILDSKRDNIYFLKEGDKVGIEDLPYLLTHGAIRLVESDKDIIFGIYPRERCASILNNIVEAIDSGKRIIRMPPDES